MDFEAQFCELLKLSSTSEEHAHRLANIIVQEPQMILYYSPGAILRDDFDQTVVHQAILSMSTVLKPSPIKSVENITGLYLALPAETRSNIKLALLRGLMFDNLPIRSSAACGIRDLAQIEYPAALWPELFDQLCAIATDSKYDESTNIGSLITLQEIFRAKRIIIKNNSPLQTLSKMCFSLIESTESIEIQSNSICLLTEIFSAYPRLLRNKDFKTPLIQISLTALNVDSDVLHTAATQCLKRLLKTLAFNQTTELIESIYEVLQLDSLSMTKQANIASLIKSIIKIEKKSTYYEQTLTYGLTETLLPFLFNIVLAGEYDDIENKSAYISSFQALNCLKEVIVISPQLTNEYCFNFFNHFCKSQTESEVISALVAIQVMVTSDSHQYIMEAIPIIAELTQSESINICISSTHILELIVQNNFLESDEEFDYIVKIASMNLKKNEQIAINSLSLLQAVIRKCSSSAHESYVGRRFDTLLALLQPDDCKNSSVYDKLAETAMFLIASLPVISTNYADQILNMAKINLMNDFSGFNIIFFDGCCRRFPSFIEAHAEVLDLLLQNTDESVKDIVIYAISSMVCGLKSFDIGRVLSVIDTINRPTLDLIDNLFTFGKLDSEALFVYKKLINYLKEGNYGVDMLGSVFKAISCLIPRLGPELDNERSDLIDFISGSCEFLKEMKSKKMILDANLTAAALFTCLRNIIDAYSVVDTEFIFSIKDLIFDLIRTVNEAKLYDPPLLAEYLSLISSLVDSIGLRVNRELNETPVKNLIEIAKTSDFPKLKSIAERVDEKRGNA